MRLRLPGWTPGSYLMRDYVRHLEELTVEQQGRLLPCRRLEPACWLVEPDPQAGELLIRYRVMATELSVRTCHLDGDHGFLALAAMVQGVAAALQMPAASVCGVGGALRHLGALRQAFSHHLSERLPQAQLLEPLGDAQQGALTMAAALAVQAPDDA
jgi:predicted metalloprotease with PDZ domain